MKINRTDLLCVGLVVVAFAMTAALYPRLPEVVPIHWSLHGRPDGFLPKPWGPFLLPVVTGVAYLLLAILPRISPRGYRIERFRSVFAAMELSIISFLFFVTALALSAAAGAAVPMDRAVEAGVGVLFVVLGNFMGKLTKNFFVGIRTPWTLASDEVWLRTHRLGGKLFVLAGIVLFLSGLARAGLVPLVVATPIAAVVPVVYSYVLYRRLEGFDGRSRADDSSHDPT